MGEIQSTANYVSLKQSLYREYSHSYDEDRRRFVGVAALAERVSWVLDPLHSGQRLLDMGCGSGDVLLAATQRTQDPASLVGLDLTPEMLDLATVRLGGAVSLVEANVLDGLPFRDQSFNLVTSLNLLQELPSSAIIPLLGEVHRTLRPGGHFRAVIPCIVASNPSSEAFRQMARRHGAMDFLLADDLERVLAQEPLFADKEYRFHPSPAASVSASGTTRFKFFAQLMEGLREGGLDPGQVQQGVVFFDGKRKIESQYREQSDVSSLLG